MDLDKLWAILDDTTVQLRKGEIISGTPELVKAIKDNSITEDTKLPSGTVTIDAMPHESEVDEDIIKVDCHFITIGVNRQHAELYRQDLASILLKWPTEFYGEPLPALEEGPNYMQVGAVIGDQGKAFQLFALGQVLGFWRVVTPTTLGFPEPIATMMAGRGLIAIDQVDRLKIEASSDPK